MAKETDQVLLRKLLAEHERLLLAPLRLVLVFHHDLFDSTFFVVTLLFQKNRNKFDMEHLKCVLKLCYT